MRLLNRASVNAFMLPFALFYLLCLNLAYTIFYRWLAEHSVKFFARIVIGAVLLNLLLGAMSVLTIPHH
jgi:hypothetical protein